MSGASEIQAAVELLRSVGLYPLRDKDLRKLTETLNHSGGDPRAIRAMMEQASEEAMYTTIAERFYGRPRAGNHPYQPPADYIPPPPPV